MKQFEKMADLWNSMTWTDLSYPFEEGMPMPADLSAYHHEQLTSIEGGQGFLSYRLVMNEHTGTHVDASAHMLTKTQPGYALQHENAFSRYSFSCVLIDCDWRNEGKEFLLEDILKWEEMHGEIKAGEGVFLRSGWEEMWTKEEGGQAYLSNFPGLSKEAAGYLAEKGVAAVGTECLSIDSSMADSPQAHYILMEKNIPVYENLCHLKDLPERFFVVSLPLNIVNGSASPLRVIAGY